MAQRKIKFTHLYMWHTRFDELFLFAGNSINVTICEFFDLSKNACKQKMLFSIAKGG